MHLFYILHYILKFRIVLQFKRRARVPEIRKKKKTFQIHVMKTVTCDISCMHRAFDGSHFEAMRSVRLKA